VGDKSTRQFEKIRKYLQIIPVGTYVQTEQLCQILPVVAIPPSPPADCRVEVYRKNGGPRFKSVQCRVS